MNGSKDSLIAEKLTATARSSGSAKQGNVKLIYLQCYFITIATILGTGILGLPVTLSHAGIYPFLVTFLLGFFMQAILIVFFTDLLQRSYAIQLVVKREDQFESIPLNDIDLDDDSFSEAEEESEHSGPVLAGHVIIPKDNSVKEPNLHMLGTMFLSCGLRQMFVVVIIIQFISILISYALAGSEAFAVLIGIDHFYVIPVFVWILTFAIVFGFRFIKPLISLMTFVKGSLLLATVVVTFMVGAEIHHEISNDWKYVGAPFLMGTVALGGIINVMPMLYAKVAPVRHQVRGFRTAVLSGLTTCMILNILWCWAVLDIVPQLSGCSTPHQQANTSTDVHPVCIANISLARSNQEGEISTIPLIKILHKFYPRYDWVAFLIELFILISITVSFLTIGGAMHHTLKGIVDSVWGKTKESTYTSAIMNTNSKLCSRFCSTQCLCRSIFSLLGFGLVFGVAMLNPKGFESMLEKIASSVLNLEAGFFVFFMIRNSRIVEQGKLKLPLPLPNCFYWLQYTLPVYFCFAIVYDIYRTIIDLLIRYDVLPAWLDFTGATVNTLLDYNNVTATTMTTMSPASNVSTTTTTMMGYLNHTTVMNVTQSTVNHTLSQLGLNLTTPTVPTA
ncbi:uncharacterized protein LOC141910911 [Tubulanus polymorphus]|uniref:uncharacterized protein LOC141910911 n=1 Tax=Tubulanus polymorphus TaxID=672921 RepID=UPI003DA3D997